MNTAETIRPAAAVTFDTGEGSQLPSAVGDAMPVETPQAPPRDAVKPFVPLIERDLGRLGSVFWFLVAWALLIGVWELGAAQGFLNDRILPPPSETIPFLLRGEAAVGFGVQRTGLFEAVLVTLGRIAIGLGGGLVCAIVLAATVIEFGPLRRIALPLVQTIAPISPVAWIPFAIAIVGIGAPAAIFVVFMAIFGSMTLSAVAAFDGVPREYVKVAQNLGASRWRIWFRVLLPAATPSILTMTRMSLFAAWMAILAGEMAGINSGLGYLIIMGQQMYNMKLVMIGIITIGVVGFLLDRVMLLIQRRVLWWENAQ